MLFSKKNKKKLSEKQKRRLAKIKTTREKRIIRKGKQPKGYSEPALVLGADGIYHKKGWMDRQDGSGT